MEGRFLDSAHRPSSETRERCRSTTEPEKEVWAGTALEPGSCPKIGSLHGLHSVGLLEDRSFCEKPDPHATVA